MSKPKNPCWPHAVVILLLMLMAASSAPSQQTADAREDAAVGPAITPVQSPDTHLAEANVEAEPNVHLGTAVQAATTTAESQDLEYVISPDDVLDVYIVDVPELSRRYRVSPSGMISVPLLTKPLTTVGLTLGQFSNLLAQSLQKSGLVSNPHVNTAVLQSRINAVTIGGAVNKPQIYPIFGHTTLLDALSQAEGLAKDASGIAIIRRGNTGIRALGLHAGKNVAFQERDSAQTQTVDLRRLMDTGNADVNAEIFPGDRITVPRAGIVYVVGAVKRPGGFTMRPSQAGMTVLQALALAEDFKPTAKPEKGFVIRPDSRVAQGHKQIPVNLKKILSGKGQDMALQADDILFVPDSSGKQVLHRSLEAIIQAGTGAAIYRP